jgi:hypothetical protein
LNDCGFAANTHQAKQKEKIEQQQQQQRSNIYVTCINDRFLPIP